MYVMSPSTIDPVNNLANSICCCPLCAGTAHISWAGLDPLLYGVGCRDCGASIPAIHLNRQDAVRLWNRRKGLAALGGKATAGKCSRLKRISCRRNLKRGREAKQLKRLRTEFEAKMRLLRSARAVERAEMQAARAENWAWLKANEENIMADPTLRRMYELLPSRIASPGTEQLDGQNRSSGVANHAGNPP